MRMPINRGMPQPFNGVLGRDLFAFPEGFSETYWLTAYYRGSLGVSPQHEVQRWVFTTKSGAPSPSSPITLAPLMPVGTRPLKLFSRYPLRNQGAVELRSDDYAGDTAPARGVWFGHVDVGKEDWRVGDRPFVAGRPDDTFVLPPTNISKQDPVVLLHTLDAGHVDLVTLRLLLPRQMQLELRFLDGTYKSGQPQYRAFVVKNENTDTGGDMVPTVIGDAVEDLFFDRHPMRGPGSIHAVVKAASSDDDRAFIYGTVHR